jgi:hypothetical protein
VSQKNYFYQKLMWDSYTALLELNSTFPSRLFPLPLGVCRDKRNNSSTFSFEYPMSPSSASALQTQLSGSAVVLPLREYLYSHHDSNRRVLAHALRHYPNMIELWCSQFGQAYRVLQHFSHIHYRFNTRRGSVNSSSNTDASADDDRVSELVNADIFVREDGSLVLGNAMVSVEEGEEGGEEEEGNAQCSSESARNTDDLVAVVTDLLSECLCLSRPITVQMDHSSKPPNMNLELDAEPEYLRSHEQEEGGGTEERGGGEGNATDRAASSSVSEVYLAEGCGLDVFPQLRNISSTAVSVQSTCVLFIEDLQQASGSTSYASMSRNNRRGNHFFNATQESGKVNTGVNQNKLEQLLSSRANVVVKMSSDDVKVVSVISVNGDDITTGKSTIDATNNKFVTMSSKKNSGMSTIAKKGFQFRVKAKSPGIAYVTIHQRAEEACSEHLTTSTRQEGSNNESVHSVTLKICVVDYPVSKSSEVCEVISLSESSFWTPLYKPLPPSYSGTVSTMRSNSSSGSNQCSSGAVNGSLYRDRVFAAQAFRHRVWHCFDLYLHV